MRYLRARTVAEAVEALADGATPLGGGTSLVPAIAGGDGPRALVDLAGIEALRVFAAGPDGLRIGAMVTLDRLGAAPEIAPYDAALQQAALSIGNPGVRRAGTVGGNVAQALPTCDLHPALLALDATIEVRHGGRALALPLGGLPAGALVEAVRIPALPGRRSRFVKLAWRAASAITVCALGAALRLEGGVVRVPRLAASGLGPRARRLPRAEAVLAGRSLDRGLVEEAATTGAAELPFDGAALPAVPGEAYRRRLVGEAIRRALGDLS